MHIFPHIFQTGHRYIQWSNLFDWIVYTMAIVLAVDLETFYSYLNLGFTTLLDEISNADPALPPEGDNLEPYSVLSGMRTVSLIREQKESKINFPII